MLGGSDIHLSGLLRTWEVSEDLLVAVVWQPGDFLVFFLAVGGLKM